MCYLQNGECTILERTPHWVHDGPIWSKMLCVQLAVDVNNMLCCQLLAFDGEFQMASYNNLHSFLNRSSDLV